jgi:hypothetical protein
VSEITNSGTPISSSGGYTGGTLYAPNAVAIDGAGNAWVADSQSDDIVELSNSGAVLSGPNGLAGGSYELPNSIAVDGSGDVWTANGNPYKNVLELIGAATPVVTPLSVGVKNNTLGTRP